MAISAELRHVGNNVANVVSVTAERAHDEREEAKNEAHRAYKAANHVNEKIEKLHDRILTAEQKSHDEIPQKVEIVNPSVPVHDAPPPTK